MRVFVFICDHCGKELSKIREEGARNGGAYQDLAKPVVSPHIVLTSLDQHRSGWVQKTDNEDLNEADELGSGWRVIAKACEKNRSGILQFCSSKCLAEYFDKLLEDYKIKKLKE